MMKTALVVTKLQRVPLTAVDITFWFVPVDSFSWFPLSTLVSHSVVRAATHYLLLSQ
jgi:hypothetical protein